MKTNRWVPILAHPATGAPLPWLDTRWVPLSTLLTYLGRGKDYHLELAASGFYRNAGCTLTTGVVRQQTSYCPAAIWAANAMVPAPAVVAACLASADAISSLRRDLTALLDALRLPKSPGLALPAAKQSAA